MTDGMWTPTALELIRRTREVHVSSRRADGGFTRGQTIWAVAVGDSVFIRSTDGPGKPWFTAAKARGYGRLRASGSEFEVRFRDVSDRVQEAIEAEYRRKYRTSPAYNVNRAAGSRATLRLIPLSQPKTL
jgi:hypothetical protein